MKLDLFQEVIVTRDFPEHSIVKGDIAILNDYVKDETGAEGCILEIYTAAEKFVGVVILPIDSIEVLQESDRLSVRRLITV